MAIVSFNFIPWVTSAAKTIGYDAIKADQLIWESVKENFPNIIEGINQCSENYIEQFSDGYNNAKALYKDVICEMFRN